MWTKLRFVALMLAVIVGTTACFGSFNLTRKLYTWNDSPDDKWVKEGYYLVTGVLLPVYGIAVLADGVVFNTIEFWTGENPVELSDAEGDDGVLVGQAQDGSEEVSIHLMSRESDPYLTVEHTVNGEVKMLMKVTREGGETRITDEQGNRVLTATRLSDGSMLVEGARGETLAFFDGAEVGAYIEGMARGEILPSSFAVEHLSGIDWAVAP